MTQPLTTSPWHDDPRHWKFDPADRPQVPGAPYTPSHTGRERIAYASIAVLVGITSGLGNALVAVNLPQLEGSLGVYLAEIAWLPTVYVMSIMSMNLVLVKFRIHFGLRAFTVFFLLLYALVTLAHIFVHTFSSAIVVRAVSGMAAAPLTTLTIYYTIQSMPPKWRLHGLLIGIGIPQLATPIARLFSTELLAFGEWRTLYTFEFGLAIAALAAVMLLPLPPTERKPAFEALDFVSFGLFAGGLAVLCAVVGLGRYLWWTDTPWLGWALCAAIPMVMAAIILDLHRSHPLIAVRFMGSMDIIRFVAVGVMIRIVLSEQTYAAVGLLNSLGLNNDQFHTLFATIAAAMVLGTLAGAAILNPAKAVSDQNHLVYPIIGALVLAAIAAGLDSHATNLTRPPQIYLTQAMLAFATTFSLGPSLLVGLLRSLRQGTAEFITYIALFGITVNFGSLIGSTLLGTFQVIREKAHSNTLVQQLTLTDPQVATRLQQSSAAYGAITVDPALRSAEGGALLSQQVTREANVLAYNDVFQLVAVVAGATALFLVLLVLLRRRRAARVRAQAASA